MKKTEKRITKRLVSIECFFLRLLTIRIQIMKYIFLVRKDEFMKIILHKERNDIYL